MKIFHTSPNKIEKINAYGIAGDCLFFSDEEYVMTASSTYFVYSLEVSEDEVIAVNQLHDDGIIEEIAEYFSVDSETAESLLDGSESEWTHDCDGEDSWWLQGKQGECAKKMGYKACQSDDEQGTVYIVPMLNREPDLEIEKEVK